VVEREGIEVGTVRLTVSVLSELWAGGLDVSKELPLTVKEVGERVARSTPSPRIRHNNRLARINL
jgi:hypothetical protein